MSRSINPQSNDSKSKISGRLPATAGVRASVDSKRQSRRQRRHSLLTAILLAGTTTAAVDSSAQAPVPQVPRTNVETNELANAQQTPSDPNQVATNRISDWGLAGVIWSDASLVRKLAAESAQRTKDPKQIAKFEQWARQSTEVKQSLESFGWRLRGQQAEQSGNPRTEASRVSSERMPANSSQPSSERSASEEEELLPDPKEVGAKLADELRRTRPPKASTSDPSDRPTDRSDREVPVQADGLERFDTENPAGVDDPGSNDELTAAGSPIDVDNYRVDDYVDETSAEEANLADAVEDGVEGAIASAAGRLGTGRDLGARISEREIQTLSATLPYSDDSIYDADDYDPDRDYRVDNPLAAEPDAQTGVDLSDGDDDIGRRADPKVIEGEDEMIAELANQEAEQKLPAMPRRSSFERFTTEEAIQERDAQWVQFQLDSNELVLTRHTTLENLQQRTKDAVMKLKSDASVAWDTTENEQLKAVLKAISTF